MGVKLKCSTDGRETNIVWSRCEKSRIAEIGTPLYMKSGFSNELDVANLDFFFNLLRSSVTVQF